MLLLFVVLPPPPSSSLFPTRRSSDLLDFNRIHVGDRVWKTSDPELDRRLRQTFAGDQPRRSEEHTSELQSPCNLVCRLLLEKKKLIAAAARIIERVPHATQPCGATLA